MNGVRFSMQRLQVEQGHPLIQILMGARVEQTWATLEHVPEGVAIKETLDTCQCGEHALHAVAAGRASQLSLLDEYKFNIDVEAARKIDKIKMHIYISPS